MPANAVLNGIYLRALAQQRTPYNVSRSVSDPFTLTFGIQALDIH